MAEPSDRGAPREASEDPRISAAARGDRAAQEALLRELLPRVRNLVRYLVRGDREVDDIAQKALIAILKGFPSFRGDGKLESWADRITARETFAHVRRERAEQRARQREAPDLYAVHGPDGKVDDYVLRRQMARALDDIPQDQRHALVLHHVVGMSVPEIAEALSIPEDTAKSRVRLGMKKLRERWAEPEEASS